MPASRLLTETKNGPVAATARQPVFQALSLETSRSGPLGLQSTFWAALRVWSTQAA